MRWNTNNMATLVSQVLHSETEGGKFIENVGPGGDYDSDALCISLYGSMCDRLFLCGFNTGAEGSMEGNHSDCDVEMLELTCHSGNGLMSASPTECEAYGKLMAALVRNGWRVVPHMKDYF
jgi:hypothetical protein